MDDPAQNAFAAEAELHEHPRIAWLESLPAQIGLILVGLGGLILGSDWLVDSARSIALAIGVPEIVVGGTIIAFGTSAPELAASIVSVIRGENDLAIGNVVGSNVINIGAGIGLTALALPVDVSERAMQFDIPVMVGISLALFVGLLSMQRLTRGFAISLAIVYCGYIVLSFAY